jgi:asparagine synthase (glutamine-hydrolysing)
MGFGVPLNHWFRDELKPLLYDTLLDRTALARGFFNEKAVRLLVEEHIAGKWDHAYRLWSLLVFELWQRMFLDQPGKIPSPAISPSFM